MKETVPQADFGPRQVYERVIAVLLDLEQVENLDTSVHPDFMGYGSAAHEFFRTREDMKKMAQMQSDQLRDQKFRYVRKPISEKYFAGGTVCLILEEFELFFPDNDHQLHLRLTTMIEKSEGRWLVTHFHGSTPDSDIAAEEAFPMEGLQRKNAELEAKIKERTRELEIEAALERTRAQSMQMQHSSELNEVSEIFHKQLLLLGIDSEFSFVWLPDEAQGSHLFWTTWVEGSPEDGEFHSKSVVYPLDKNEPYTALCFSDWESGEPIHEHFVPQEDIKSFFDSWEELLEGAERLKAEYFPEGIYYTEAFMKYGCFGIDIRRPLTVGEKSVLHRFAIEFERTYTRFLDLKKAEAQAREAQIEAALERVRSASMAMQKTEDISEVAVVFLNQLKELQLNFIQAWIDVFHLEEGYFDIWFSPLDGVYEEPRHLQLPSAIFEDTSIKSWKAGNKFSYVSLQSKEEVDALVAACDAASGTDYFSHFQEILKLDRLEFVDANHKYGTVSKSSFERATKEEEEILQRFAKVFEQTYTRFLDLKKAEAQAREAEIELALERVRNRAMSMRSSGELAELVITVFQELSGLDMVLTRCLLWIFNPEDDSSTAWMTNSEDPNMADSYFVPYHDHPAYHSLLKAWKSRNPKWEYELKGNSKDGWDEILVYGYFASLPEAIKQAMKEPACVILSGSFNKFGALQTASLEPLSQENRDILLRFSQVFEQAYTRFNDLLNAEAQAREAQIEAALERIRAKVTGMQESKELLDVVVTMRSEFVKLGHEAHYFWHMRWLPEQYQKAMTSGDGTRIGMVMELPRHMHGDIPLLAEWEKSRQPTVVYAMDAEAAVDYVDKMVRLGDFQQIDPQAPSADDIRHIGGLTFVMARTTHGEIGFSLPGEVPDPPGEALETLKRFAGVFDLAYRRFEDLKESERQKREAEIELALERVRARTMAMQNSSELKEVIRLIFDQLARLEINAEHAGIVVDYSPGQDWNFWVAETQEIPSKISIPYLDSLWDRQYTKAKEEGTDFFTTKLDFEEKNSFYEALLKHIPGLTKETREFYRTCPGLAISTVVEEDVGLYIENFSGEPYTEEENSILRRFGSVFQQTYTRFLDLKKAEAQAREAQIEAALERVRAQTMAMHRSEELSDVLSTLFKQFDILGINPSHAVLTLINREKNTLNFRMTGRHGHRVVAEQEVDLEVADAWLDTTEKWKKSEPNAVNVNEYPPEVLPDVWEVYSDILEATPAEAQPKIEHFPNGLFITEGYCRFGYIGFAHDRRPTEEEKEIVKRIAGEFGTLYQRFLDLKKAEDQAREAQIEAALERVRAQTMAMHQSEDLEKSAAIVFEELEKLDLNIERCGIGIFDPETKSCRLWSTVISDDGEKELATGVTSLTIHPMLTATFSAWESQQPYSHILEGEELKDYYKIISKGDFYLSEELIGKSVALPREYYHYAPFKAGGLYFFSDSKPLDSDIQIMRRFAEVFDMTYTRYEDLKKAEDQAREARIEAALEKVRSRTMAMQHSDELPEAANVLFLEIQALGIPAWSCGYNILAADKRSATCWMSSEGTLQKPFTLRLWGEASFEEMGAFIRRDDAMLVQELGGKALEEHYAFMLSFPDLQPIFEDLKEEGLELPTYQINHLCKFTHGFLLFITYEKVPDAHDVFKRFTNVFEQTYTRFLDLKRAEAQARESKIETAMERVRARALAMQEPEELKDVARVMRQEMGQLGVEELETSSIYIHDTEAGKTECWYAIKDIRKAEKVMASDHFSLELKDTWVGREMLKFYGSGEDQVSIVMKGVQRKEWIDYCEAHSKALKGYYGEVIPERTYHLYKFSHGAIGAATPGDLSNESWKLLQRAASVFSLAYSRFRDLTQARIDLQKLKEEKKRAEDALKELQLTQQQLVHAEKMASLGELTAGIAHEIQNPLNFVNNFSDVSRELLEELLEEMEKGDAEEVDAIARDVIQNLEKIVHHGRRADSIVKGMLQHSRSGDGKKEPTDLNALADEYFRLAYHGLRAKDKSFNATMETSFDPGLREVEVIPQDIGRVLLNLITNAFHAVSEQKEKQSEGYTPTVWVQTRNTDTGVELSVRDNGGGIPESIRDKIFQPFFTTKPTGEGTGLGLSMSYDIVTKGHGGTLQARVEDNEGSEFILTLNT